MTDPYEREKIPAPPVRPRVDFWRPVRWLVWQALREIRDDNTNLVPDAARVWALLLPLAIPSTVATCYLLLLFARFEDGLFVVSIIVGQLVPLLIRWWIRSAMRLDEEESRDYWKERFRL
jgi:hypothetical protein